MLYYGITREQIEDAIRVMGVLDLSGKNLQGLDLSGLKLRGSDLSGADLRKANLSGADLSGTDLRGADLRQANVFDTKFTGAKCNNKTKWPMGFVPDFAGLINTDHGPR